MDFFILSNGGPMAAGVPFCQMIGINPNKLSKEEYVFLERELFFHVYLELLEIFRKTNKSYFQLMKFNKQREDEMLEANFFCYLVNDILVSKEYSLEGMAYYMQVPVEVIKDMIIGCNKSPSFSLIQKIINLHRMVRPNLYQEMMLKIIGKYINKDKMNNQLQDF